MADPLSIIASISTITANFLRIGPMLWHFVEHTRDAPVSASQIVAEIFSVDKTLENLKDYLLRGPGFNVASRPILSLTLSACSTTYLELERLVGKCVSGGRVQRLKWVFYEEDIGVMLGRLQAHKLSLMAVVQIVQCESMQEVKDSLQMLSDRVDEHFAEMKRSVDTITANDVALKTSDPVNWSAGHTFEAELQSSRVYRNLGSRNSIYTYSSDARASVARSAFSNISLGNVSVVAVTYLRLWCADLANAEHYRFGRHDPALESRLMELADLEAPICCPIFSRVDAGQGDVASDEDSASQYSQDEVEYVLADDDPGDGKYCAHIVDFGERYTVADTLEAFVARSWHGQIERDDSPKDHAEHMDIVNTQGILDDPLSGPSFNQQPDYDEGKRPTTNDSMESVVLIEPVCLQVNLVELGREERENSEFIQQHMRIKVPESPILGSTDTGSALENLQATIQFDTTPSTNTEVISGCWSTPAGIGSVLKNVEEEIEEHDMGDIHVVDDLILNIESSLSCPSERPDISDDIQPTYDAAHTVHQKSLEDVPTLTTAGSIGLVGISSLESAEQSCETRDSKQVENHHLAKCSADYSPQYDADTETAPLIKLKSNEKRRTKKEKRRRRVRRKAGEDDGEHAGDKVLANGAMEVKTIDEEARLNQVEETITERRDECNKTKGTDICVSDGCVDDTERANITTIDIAHTPGSATEVTLDSTLEPEDTSERCPGDQPPEIETSPGEDVAKTPADDWDTWCKEFLEKHDAPEHAMDNSLDDLPDESVGMRKDALKGLDQGTLEATVKEALEDGRMEIDMAIEKEHTPQSVEDCNDGCQSFVAEFDAQNAVVNTPDGTPVHNPEDVPCLTNLSIVQFREEIITTTPAIDRCEIVLDERHSDIGDTGHEPKDTSKHTSLDPTQFTEENDFTTYRCEDFLEKPSSDTININHIPSPASPKSTHPPNNRDSGYMSLSETNAETERAIYFSRNSGVATHFDDPQPCRSLDLIPSYRRIRTEYFIYVSFALLLPCVMYDLCWATPVRDEL